VTFGDLYEEDQKEIINEEFDNAYAKVNKWTSIKNLT
jgi:hypothetical protein